MLYYFHQRRNDLNEVTLMGSRTVIIFLVVKFQRIEIARSILAKRSILLADEATSALDNELSLQIHQVLLKNSNFAVIEVAHKISHQEKEMFDRIIDLSK